MVVGTHCASVRRALSVGGAVDGSAVIKCHVPPATEPGPFGATQLGSRRHHSTDAGAVFDDDVVHHVRRSPVG